MLPYDSGADKPISSNSNANFHSTTPVSCTALANTASLT